jgi:hypothetical protein
LAKKESRFLLAQLGVALVEERSFLPNCTIRDIPTPLCTENLVCTDLVRESLNVWRRWAQVFLFLNLFAALFNRDSSDEPRFSLDGSDLLVPPEAQMRGVDGSGIQTVRTALEALGDFP